MMGYSQLIDAARSVLKNAYAPYSEIHVGAAVLTDIGIFTGVNVENASYGLSMCGERAAVFTAVSSGAKKVLAVAVVTDLKEPIPPCGACRQVLAEFGGPNMEVILEGGGGKRIETKLSELLPSPFLPDHLKR